MIRNKIKKLMKKEASEITEIANSFFVHIPKTAGTSFRSALEDSSYVVADYGAKSAKTSRLISEYIYKENNFLGLKNALAKESDTWLCGHVPLNRFTNFVPVRRTITFVREPFNQIVSHYNHFVSYYNYTDDIEKFINRPGMLNIQARLLNSMPIGLIGYIGITERFDESLSIINHHLKISLKSIKRNINETKTLSVDSLSDEQKQLILTKNSQDFVLYEKAKILHQQRLKALSEKKDWVYSFVNLNMHHVLHGCAFYAEKEDVVNLVILINGIELLKAKANGFYGGQPKVNYPRERYIGFHIPLRKHLSNDDIVDVYVVETRQKLTFEPLRVSG